MILNITTSEFYEYVFSQVQNIFPDKKTYDGISLNRDFDYALERIEFCFDKIDKKYYKNDNGEVVFNYLNGDHYAMFLYFLSHTIYKNDGNLEICTKLFLLNKYLHGIDVFYEIDLPNIFLFVHPLATVLGRAAYSDYLIVYQQCNVGSNDDIYPVLGRNLTLHPGASVLGNCHVGDNCSIAARGLLIDKDLDDNSIYFGQPRNCFIKKKEVSNKSEMI